METKDNFDKNDKDFDTVRTFREIKENISKDIWGLSYENLMEYFKNSKRVKTQSSMEMAGVS